MVEMIQLAALIVKESKKSYAKLRQYCCCINPHPLSGVPLSRAYESKACEILGSEAKNFQKSSQKASYPYAFTCNMASKMFASFSIRQTLPGLKFLWFHTRIIYDFILSIVDFLVRSLYETKKIIYYLCRTTKKSYMILVRIPSIIHLCFANVSPFIFF